MKREQLICSDCTAVDRRSSLIRRHSPRVHRRGTEKISSGRSVEPIPLSMDDVHGVGQRRRQPVERGLQVSDRGVSDIQQAA